MPSACLQSSPLEGMAMERLSSDALVLPLGNQNVTSYKKKKNSLHLLHNPGLLIGKRNNHLNLLPFNLT